MTTPASEDCIEPGIEHDLDVHYEDATMIQGTCRRCGAEMDEDKQEPGYGE